MACVLVVAYFFFTQQERRTHIELASPATAQQGHAQWRGANVLQKSSVSWQDPKALQSLKQLQKLGADTVILVPFLHQSLPTSSQLNMSNAVTDAQLIAGIMKAKTLGLRIMLKLQILVDNSWAGEINPAHEQGWKQWFSDYETYLLHYADIAELYHVEALIIGTELEQSGNREEWGNLIAQVRKRYSGKLSYAAHGLSGVDKFNHWALLDAISVTLYPPLKPNIEIMANNISHKLQQLRRSTLKWNKPVWVVEYGMPSASGSADRPWDWNRLQNDPAITADIKLQADAFAAWDTLLSQQKWIEGYAFWDWFTDPNAGGAKDKDYTIQNKATETLIACLWNRCALNKKEEISK